MPGGQKEERGMVNGEISRFKYPDIVADCYRCRGSVDNHDSYRHYGGTKSQIGLGVVLGTTWCPIQVLDLFIACT